MQKQKYAKRKRKKLTIPEGYSLVEHGVTFSLLSAFQRCRQLWLYKLNRYYNPLTSKTTLFGNYIHSGLEWLYSGENVEAAIKKAIRDNKEEEQGVDPQKIELDRGIAKTIFSHYAKIYKEEIRKKEFTDTEINFNVSFNKIRLRGKIDAAKITGKNRIWLVEHKTKSRIEEDALIYRLHFDLQTQIYLMAYKLITGRAAHGIIYNVIRKPQIYQRKSESLSDYCRRVDVDIECRPDFYFKRYEMVFTKKEQAEFEKDLQNKLDEMERVISGDLAIWKNECNCIFPFKCPFLPACASGSLAGYEQQEYISPELTK